MSKLGEEALVVAFERLTPHLERASSQLAYFLFNKKREMEPEDKLAIYVKLRALKKKNESNSNCGGFDERAIVSRDVDFDSSDYGSSWNSRSAVDELSQGNEQQHKERDE